LIPRVSRVSKAGGLMLRQWTGPLRFLLTVGWYVALSLIIPIGIGFLLDRRFDRSPLFTFIGLGIGTVIAFYGLFRMLRRYKAEQDELTKEKK
jgi:drug/metabolite transporter (DMT)-like permease